MKTIAPVESPMPALVARRPAKLAPLLILAAGAASAVALVITTRDWFQLDNLLALSAAAFTVVGSLILYRTDGNRVGWVMAAIGLSLFVSGITQIMADRGYLVAEAVAGAAWLSWFVLFGLLVYWFPTGEPVTPRWRFLRWIALLLGVITSSYILVEDLCVEAGADNQCLVWAKNPIGMPGIPNPEFGPFSTVGYMVLIAFVLISSASLIVRFVRSKDVERLQMKWFAFAVVTMIAVTVVQETLVDIIRVPMLFWEVLSTVAVVAVPIAIGISVTRYRLYEIDRIVSRTVTYVLVVALLGAVFFGVVTLVSALMPAESDLVVAASTLAVAASFNPLRRSVQVRIDRRFNRARYDAQVVMDAFAASLRERVHPAEVSEGWREVVSDTMQPTIVGVWVH